MEYRCIRAYKAADKIRALAWHPQLDAALVVGSANGDINKLKINFSDVSYPCVTCSTHSRPPVSSQSEKDFTSLEQVPKFVHVLRYNHDGTQLAISCGWQAPALVEHTKSIGMPLYAYVSLTFILSKIVGELLTILRLQRWRAVNVPQPFHSITLDVTLFWSGFWRVLVSGTCLYLSKVSISLIYSI